MYPSAPPSYDDPPSVVNTAGQLGFNSLQQHPPVGQRASLSGAGGGDDRMLRFQQLVDRYEINREFAKRLRSLDGYEVVFIVDDSGSMNTPLGDIAGPYDKNPTRWDELRQTVSIVVDIASVFDPDGVDIFFLNREPMRSVKDATELIPTFAVPAAGPTPIVPVLRQVLREKALEIQERKLLILLATDGVPTNDAGQRDVRSLENVLKNERQPANRIPVTIIACTDDDECIGYLNNWDKKIPYLDVADDYRSEREEIWKVQGRSFPFSFGDYVVKILMGSVDPWFDGLDEKKVSGEGPSHRGSHHHGSTKRSICTIL